jgi:uncharacterized NAD-dependent epimerase/dehydratase family protein
MANHQAESSRRNRRMVVLTDGHSDPLTAKTACSVIRYCPDEVVAVLDSTAAGQTSAELLGVGGEIPVVADLQSAPDSNTLMIGIAPPGGKIPSPWRPIVLEAISRGMDVVSGLHEFLADDRQLAEAASKSGARLVDVRRNDEHDVANYENVRQECLRVLTVGQDCCVGKMVVAIELAAALRERQQSTKFIATGQTGIIIEGDGCPIDCVVSDFISGAVEKQILAHQHHDILLVEGQGSLAHPRYSAVTLGLLHGCLPQGMVLCYEAGRQGIHGMPHVNLRNLIELRSVYETMASLLAPSKVIGVAMNSRLLSAEAAEVERERVRRELGLPVCDVIRHGPDELVDAVLELQGQLVTG